MKMLRPLATSAAASFLLCGGALASSSPWIEVEGGSVRLVTSGRPDAEGRLQGVLDIKLSPGWKTYWRDPGAAGVPPTIDISTSRNVVGASLDFPAPERHHDGTFSWAGYSRPVGLPVTFQLDDPTLPATVGATIFLGICETICVPVKATLALDPDADPDNPDDVALVSSARAGLPAPATPDFGVRVVGMEGKNLVVQAIFPGSADGADLFVAADNGYAFEEPKKSERDGRTYFTIPAVRPDTPPEGDGLHYTLVTAGGAVSGILPYF
jgi:DsbC/DsbD-like thiol-disulfide interchange protein